MPDQQNRRLFTFFLAEDDVNLILNALAALPYKMVFELIDRIRGQFAIGNMTPSEHFGAEPEASETDGKS